jgi:hypothetical protein
MGVLDFPNYGGKKRPQKPGAISSKRTVRRKPLKVKMPGKGAKRGQNKG